MKKNFFSTRARFATGSLLILCGLITFALLMTAGQWGPTCAYAGGSPATATAQVPPPDNDHDGINDDLEQKLAEMYAPMIYIEADESNYPVNVDWMLSRAQLHYHEDCRDDVEDNVGPFPVSDQLLGPDPSHYWVHGQHCGSDDTGYSHPPHRPITPVAADPDGQWSVGSQTTGYSDQQTFELNDLPDSEHIGSTDPHYWVTYFHAYPSSDGGIMIQYWHLFAYNQFGGGGDDHGGDWDASIQVQLDKNLNLEGVWFSRHLDDHPGKFFPADESKGKVRFFNQTHPVVTIDGGGHAAFRSPDDWQTCDCRFGESITGVLGTIVWTDDAATCDDPTSLRRVEITCSGDDQGHLICTPTLTSSAGGVIWKTWTDGGVTAAGSLTNPITAPSAHGGLVNLGEYNPCTDSSCYGSRQASPLLAGQFYPLNNQFWLSYSGRWGSSGQINSGPRGPVFQGFIDNGEGNFSVYAAWYNQGAEFPAANDGHTPWLLPPSTTANVGSPSYSNGGTTFVSGVTNITLSASQSDVATKFGSVATYYRFYQSGGVLSSFKVYTSSFALNLGQVALPDGVYKVEYYSIDGLGNADATHTLTLTLDNTSPVTTINQPAATQYPHSAMLTLDYSVSDGTGSGVASFAASMDNAPTLLDGHSLQSGSPPINLLTEMAVGTHTFSVTGTDNVGNAGTSNVIFTIVVTPESIKGDVIQFLQSGNIKNSGQANSLLAKLNAAAKARARGDCKTAANNYQAFINELHAQSGKGVDAAAAAIMIADAQYLIAHCP